MSIRGDAVYHEDCLKGLKKLDSATVDLAFADPPFNIGYDYDVYQDKLESDRYLAWSRDWTAEVVRVLKPHGTFWLAIGDEYAAELKLMLQKEHGLTCRSWVVWYYTFGVHCTSKFSRSHTHLFHMVKDPKKFTFNAEDAEVRVPSARQLVYADRRANPKGRLPDDTWILRPQDLPEGFQPEADTWYFPRVCGTFAERAGWHGCQMPERLLARIIRACSNAGEVVLDPFAGSGTTLAVAKKLGRRFVGFEISEQYVAEIRKRLSRIKRGDPFQGAPEPLQSVPSTAAGRRLGDRRAHTRARRCLEKTSSPERQSTPQELCPSPDDVNTARRSFEPQDYGVDLPKEDFMDRMLDAFNDTYRGNQSLHELLLRPQEAMNFCNQVRERHGFHKVPDDVILRSIMQLRKHP